MNIHNSNYFNLSLTKMTNAITIATLDMSCPDSDLGIHQEFQAKRILGCARFDYFQPTISLVSSFLNHYDSL